MKIQKNKSNFFKNILMFCILALFITSVACVNQEPQKPIQPIIPIPTDINYEFGTYEETNLDISKELTTINFKSLEELEDFIKNNQNNYDDYYGMNMRNVALSSEIVAMDSMGGDMAKSISMPQRDYSETNIQVKGVDEADIIKTDGNYIYTISGNTLFIIYAYPGEDAEIVSTIEFKQRPSNLFLNDDKIAVFGNFNDVDYFKKLDISSRSSFSFFNIYDVSDKKNPNLIKEFKFQGNYFNARMIEDDVYLVTSTGGFYDIITPLPIIIDGENMRNMPIDSIYYYNRPYNNVQFINIYSINLDKLENTDSKSVAVEYSQNMYMSHENIYITYTEYINEYDLSTEIMMELMESKLSQTDKKIIEKIKLTDNEVLSQNEKKQKIIGIYYNYFYMLSEKEMDDLEDKMEKMLEEKIKEIKYFEYTAINKIGIDNGKITVKDNGKVPGRIINQFSMDEHDNVFRIATTISARWSRHAKDRTLSTNNVYTLDKKMNIIGKLEGLAEDESIYSTRFIGDKLYMVTFKQIDPFFVIDLSDPKNPKDLGELKIPGFSRYLHPYDENTIIGIGQDATETGRIKGLKISLFDVSDVNNPIEKTTFVTEEKYAQSTALYEHKAFLFSKEKELLVIPAYSYDYSDSSKGYNGAFVFKITEDEITLRGLIDHSMTTKDRWYYGASVERSLYIEDMLYTKSNSLLRINDLETLKSVKNITLEQKTTNIPIY
jgi:inhibitor of cysteine peptidase